MKTLLHSLVTGLASPQKCLIWGIADMWFLCPISPDIFGENILTSGATSKPPKPTKNVADLDSFFGFRAGMMVATQEILPEFNFI